MPRQSIDSSRSISATSLRFVQISRLWCAQWLIAPDCRRSWVYVAFQFGRGLKWRLIVSLAYKPRPDMRGLSACGQITVTLAVQDARVVKYATTVTKKKPAVLPSAHSDTAK